MTRIVETLDGTKWVVGCDGVIQITKDENFINVAFKDTNIFYPFTFIKYFEKKVNK